MTFSVLKFFKSIDSSLLHAENIVLMLVTLLVLKPDTSNDSRFSQFKNMLLMLRTLSVRKLSPKLSTLKECIPLNIPVMSVTLSVWNLMERESMRKQSANMRLMSVTSLVSK